MEELTLEQVQQLLNNSSWSNSNFSLKFSNGTIFINENITSSLYNIEERNDSFFIVLNEFPNKPSIEIVNINNSVLTISILKMELSLNRR